MTWSLTGEGGFFNSRQKARAFYMQSIAEEEYNFSTQLVKNQVRQYYNKIIEYEKQMEILIPMVSNARKQYDETLASYMRKQTSFLQLKDALTNLKYSEVNYENLKYDHMNSKIKLAQILGIDDLPGESFEKLIIQKDKE
jgi:outer membrane protein TolC